MINLMDIDCDIIRNIKIKNGKYAATRMLREYHENRIKIKAQLKKEIREMYKNETTK